MTNTTFKAGSYTVNYNRQARLPDTVGANPDIYSPREKLSFAFQIAGVEKPRFMGTDMIGVVNCELTSQEQVTALEKAGYRPAPGHCGSFEII